MLDCFLSLSLSNAGRPNGSGSNTRVGASSLIKSSGRTARALAIALGAWLGANVISANAATRHVPTEYSTIQAAIDASVSGDTILVAPGTYRGVGNREIQFRGQDVVLIGTGGAAATILDCETAGRGFDIRAMETRAAVIRGFTIKNGRATLPTWPGGFAGGISCRGHSDPTIQDCVIEACGAQEGGGLGFSDSSPRLERCRIAGNFAVARGGGIENFNLSHPELVDCVLTGNVAARGGAIYNDNSSLWLEGSTVASNEATTAGGGLFGDRALSGTLIRCLLSANCAPTGSDIALAAATNVVTLDCCAVVPSGIDPGDGSVIEATPGVASDPRLCLPASCTSAPTTDGLYELASDSPCLPSVSPCGAQIGALGEGCGSPVSVPEPEVHDESWGRLKARFE